MKIRTKTLLVVFALIVVTTIMGTISYKQNVSTQERYTQLHDHETEIRFILKEVQYELTGYSNDQRGYLLSGDEEYKTSINEKINTINADIESIKKMEVNKKTIEYLTTFEEAFQKMTTLTEKIQVTYQVNPEKGLQLHFSEERDLRKKELIPALDQLITYFDDQTHQKMQDIKQVNENANLIMLISNIFTIILGIVAVIIIFNALKPLQNLIESFKTVAKGNLTENIETKSHDEVGQLTISLNQMIEALRSTITTIYHSSHQLAASAEELSASSEQSSHSIEHISKLSQNLANASEQQLDKFVDMVNSIHKLSSGIQQVDENSDIMDELSVKTKEAALQGHNDIKIIVSEMNNIHASVEDTFKIIQGLEEKSAAIENIVSLISSIAEQTNLLALNAAIEAARAGEHGKGFAVVADEVRKLAEESKNSTNNVREVLIEIQKETQFAVQSMKNGLGKVEIGIESTKQINNTFQTIELSIEQLFEQVAEMSNYLKEMNRQSDKIVTFVDEVKQLAESNASITHESLATTQEQLATSEEILASAETLAKLADDQKLLVSNFKIE